MRFPWQKQLKIFWKGWGVSILVAIIIATSFKSAIADWNIVPTGSMKPTIVEGDRIFVNKLAYDLKIPYTTWHLAEWGNPQRGEIVVFYSPEDGTRLVKRVIGLPGDRLEMRKNQLIINGEKVKYESLEEVRKDLSPFSASDQTYTAIENLNGTRHPVAFIPRRPSMHTFGPLVIPEEQFFMLGDNRDNSGDSRYFGFVARQQIVGRATHIVASLDSKNYYQPRWERFFTRLP